jgi:type IV secretory pathway VirB2 component (pilin)
VTVLVAVAVQGGAVSPGEQRPFGGEADAVLSIVAGGFAATVAVIV